MEADGGGDQQKREFRGFVAKSNVGGHSCSLTVSLPRRPHIVIAATVEAGRLGSFSLEVSSAEDASARLAPLGGQATRSWAPESSSVIDSLAAPRSASLSAPLPPEWRMAFDPHGTEYYYHAPTGRVQYERPSMHGRDDSPSSACNGSGSRDDYGGPYHRGEHLREAYERPAALPTAVSEGSRFEWDPPLPPGKPDGFDGIRYEFDPPLPPRDRSGGAAGVDRRGGGPLAMPDDEMRARIADVEKEALRLRGMLSEARTGWADGVKRAARSRPSAPPLLPWAEGPPPPPPPPGPLGGQAAHDLRKRAQEQWTRRLEAGRGSSNRALQVLAQDKVSSLGEDALLDCDYASKVLRIKAANRRPRGPSTGTGRSYALTDAARSSKPAGSRPSATASRGAPTDAGLAPAAPRRPASEPATDVQRFLSSTSAAGASGGGAGGILDRHSWQVLSSAELTIGKARGSRSGQFNHPAYVAMLPGGDVCVADSSNQRLQLMAPPEGDEPAEVLRVLGTRVVAGRLLAHADTLRLGHGIACDRGANVLYAIDAGLRSADGEPPSHRPGGLAAVPAPPRVRKLNLSSVDGELLVSSSREVELGAPEGVGLSADGQTLCIADSAKHHVLVLHAPTLTVQRTLGRRGGGLGQLRAPEGVAVHEEMVFVADVCNHRISVFYLDGGAARQKDRALGALSRSEPGGLVRTIGRLGSDVGLFEFPRGVAIAHGWLLVSEARRIQLLTLEGSPLQVLTVPGAKAMRGLATDGWRAYAADYEAHVVHVLKVDKLGAPVGAETTAKAALTVRFEHTEPSRADDDEEAATRRIRAFMLQHDVVFNGAGEASLPSVPQAWSVEHLDEGRRTANKDTIKGVAAILREYPRLHCEVHGETGAANSAPERLAVHLQLHPMDDVAEVMDALASLRARACLNALVAEGVPESQLFTTHKGMAGGVKVDFIPRGTAARQVATAASEFTSRRPTASDFLQAGASPPHAVGAPWASGGTGACSTWPSRTTTPTASSDASTAAAFLAGLAEGPSDRGRGAESGPGVAQAAATASGGSALNDFLHFGGGGGGGGGAPPSAGRSPHGPGRVGVASDFHAPPSVAASHLLNLPSGSNMPPLTVQPSNASSCGVECAGSAAGASASNFLSFVGD